MWNRASADPLLHYLSGVVLAGMPIRRFRWERPHYASDDSRRPRYPANGGAVLSQLLPPLPLTGLTAPQAHCQCGTGHVKDELQ